MIFFRPSTRYDCIIDYRSHISQHLASISHINQHNTTKDRQVHTTNTGEQCDSNHQPTNRQTVNHQEYNKNRMVASPVEKEISREMSNVGVNLSKAMLSKCKCVFASVDACNLLTGIHMFICILFVHHMFIMCSSKPHQSIHPSIHIHS